MFIVKGDDATEYVTNEDGDILVRDSDTDVDLWIPANQIHLIDDTMQEDGQNSDCILPGEDQTINWNNELTLLLIDLYKKHEKDFERSMKKVVWQKITKEVCIQAKRQISERSVENKWKSLKRTYKSIKLKHSHSGSGRKHWDYYILMDDILGSKPEITPPAIASSSSGVTTINDSGPSTSKENKYAVETLFPDEMYNNHKEKPAMKRKLGPNINDRHRDKMARQDKFLQLFEKLVDKM